jgi:alpha/beta superfamily hydrolase
VQIKSASLPMSRQRVIPDANHYFTNRGDALVEVIADWLDDNWPAE